MGCNQSVPTVFRRAARKGPGESAGQKRPVDKGGAPGRERRCATARGPLCVPLLAAAARRSFSRHMAPTMAQAPSRSAHPQLPPTASARRTRRLRRIGKIEVNGETHAAGGLVQAGRSEVAGVGALRLPECSPLSAAYTAVPACPAPPSPAAAEAMRGLRQRQRRNQLPARSAHETACTSTRPH